MTFTSDLSASSCGWDWAWGFVHAEQTFHWVNVPSYLLSKKLLFVLLKIQYNWNIYLKDYWKYKRVCVCVCGGVATGACAHEGQKSALDSLQLKTDSCAPPYVGPGNWTWSSKRTSYFF